MGAILNGIALHGGTRPYGGTFLVFSDYMRPSVRLAALMKLPVTYVWTHDSIGLGEDGPTHQPVEHLTALRAIPGLDVVRPADANETAWAWRQALEHTDRPTALALSRQALPTLDRDALAGAEGVAKGGYVLAEASQRQAAGDHHRHRLGGAALPHRPGAAGGRRHPDPGRLDALPGVVLRAGRGVPRVGAAARGKGTGERGGGHRACPGADRRRLRREREPGALRRERPAPVLFEQFGFTPDRIVAAAHAALARVGRHHRFHDRQLRGAWTA